MEIYYLEKNINENLINLDKRLLKNYYKIMVIIMLKINSSFAKMIKMKILN